MKHEFNPSEELTTIGAVETIINGYCKQECTAEDMYLASSVCEGKIKYFSTFKKSVGMVYTHLIIVIDCIIDNNMDGYKVAYEEYSKAFYKVFKHMIGEDK